MTARLEKPTGGPHVFDVAGRHVALGEETLRVILPVYKNEDWSIVSRRLCISVSSWVVPSFGALSYGGLVFFIYSRRVRQTNGCPMKG